MLSVQDISKSFEGRPLLDQVCFEVPSGQTIAILGPSGCGKSTLLKVIAGLLTPESGLVTIDTIDVTNTPTHKRNIGLVFQDNQLFPHIDVYGNIEFGLKMLGWRKDQRSARVKELLELVGLPGFQKRQVSELSGGESKRVALARSLAPKPKALLLDEPLTGLDEELHDQLLGDLKTALTESNTTTVLVTHDKAEAQALATKTVNLL